MIKKFASLNGYTKNIVNAIIKHAPSKKTLTNGVISNEEQNKIPTVFIYTDYPGKKGEHLLKKCLKKLGCFTNQKVNFVCHYSVTKILLFTNMKNKLNKLNKSNVLYQFSCRGCEFSCIGKTERTLFKRTKEHISHADLVIKGQLEHLFSINNSIMNDVNTHEFRLNLVCQNTRIIDESKNWNILLFKEA